MNDRIGQLLDQAHELAREEVKSTPKFEKYAPSYTIPCTEIHVGLGLSYEKFAELIVRECRPWLADDAFEEVKRHLGIEQ